MSDAGLIGKSEGEEPSTVPPYYGCPSGEGAGAKVEGSRVQFLWGVNILSEFYVSYSTSYFNYETYQMGND